MPKLALVPTDGEFPDLLRGPRGPSLSRDGPDLETQLWAAQSIAAIEPRICARCRVRGRSGIDAGGADELSRRPQDSQKLQHHTDQAERAGRQRKAKHEPREDGQADSDEEQSQTERGKQIVHDQQALQPLEGNRSSPRGPTPSAWRGSRRNADGRGSRKLSSGRSWNGWSGEGGSRAFVEEAHDSPSARGPC